MKNSEENLALVRGNLGLGATKAESALLAIGKEEGDESVALIVKQMTAQEIVAITAEFDMTKPSIVSPFVTTKQFIAAFEKLGSRWSLIGDDEEFDLRAIQSKIEAFLMPMIIAGSNSYHNDRLEALLRHPLGVRTLALLGIEQQGYLEFISEPSHATAWLGTWQEIYAEIALNHQASFAKIARAIRRLSKFTDKRMQNDLRDTLNALATMAKGDQTKGTEPKKEQVFVDI